MPLSFVQRLLQPFTPRPPEPGCSVSPGAPQPPRVRPASGWPRRLGAWLASTPAIAAPTALDDWRPTEARSEELKSSQSTFRTVLDDIPMQQSSACLESIRAAHSMHELWHLRAEVFNLVSRNRTQAEANRRLAVLDLHFPSRARRSHRISGHSSREGHESVPPC